MGDAPDPPGFDALLARIQATDPAQLRTTAAAMDTGADAFYTIRGKVAGCTSDIVNFWKGYTFEPYYNYTTKLDSDLGGAEWALRDIATQLRKHAGVTESAQQTVMAESAMLSQAGQYASQQEYATMQQEAYQKVSGATKDFHTSEQTVRADLWATGATAPGGIPLPKLPPVPKQAWWKDLLFGSNQPGPQYWLTKDGKPWTSAKDGEPYGYDEDGHLVPAYEAGPMSQQMMEDGVPIGPLIKWLARGGKVAEDAEAADGLAATVARSGKWSSGDIDKHIREFYNLPGNANDPVPEWAKTEFLDLIGKSGSAGKLFTWSLRGQQGAQKTFSTLVRDPDTKQWLIAQFYADGPNAGEFATAFRPTQAQLDAMLRQNAVK